MMAYILENVHKSYDRGRSRALAGISLTVPKAEVVALMGPSGSGKSTLLNLMGTLDRPTKGQILFNGQDLYSHLPLHRFRSSSIGFVFQFHHLIPSLTILENVELALIPSRTPSAERRARAGALLDEMGLADRQSYLPPDTSGGERQRAAIARALVHRPEVLLADEPTGNLDSETGNRVMTLLVEKCRRICTTVLIATHNPEIAALADRQLFIRDGRMKT